MVAIVDLRAFWFRLSWFFLGLNCGTRFGAGSFECWEGNGIAVAVWLSSLGTMGGGLVLIGKSGFSGGDKAKRDWACNLERFWEKFGL